MPSTFQDDEREEAMRQLFGLMKYENEGRSGVDAHMDLYGTSIPFELKTTSTGNVTTVRDFGPEHIAKWSDKHWLIGVYKTGGEYYLYAPPNKMAPWIKEKAEYIRSDFELADLLPSRLTDEDMSKILENKAEYTLDDAKKVQKRQYTMSRYRELMDIENKYSPSRMLDILMDRSRYLIMRGSTLNNPHIPSSYFEGWPRIIDNHTETLRSMVKKYMDSVE